MVLSISAEMYFRSHGFLRLTANGYYHNMDLQIWEDIIWAWKLSLKYVATILLSYYLYVKINHNAL